MQYFGGKKFSRPLVAVDEVHILGEAMTMHADFRMHVRSHQGRPFVADGAVTRRRAFRTTGHNADVLGHEHTLTSQIALYQGTPSGVPELSHL